MQRATILVKGRVQKVGYRDFVAQIANKMDISGTVQNLVDGKTVKIIAEAKKNILEEFVSLLWAKEDNIIKVTKIDVEYEPSNGDYEFFDIIYDDIQKENYERISEAVSFLKSLDSGQKIMISKQDKMLEKQDNMLEKQDKMLEKQDETINSINKSRIEIKSEIHGLRDDFKSRFDERLSKIEFELAEIKAKVAAIHHVSSSSHTKISQTD